MDSNKTGVLYALGMGEFDFAPLGIDEQSWDRKSEYQYENHDEPETGLLFTSAFPNVPRNVSAASDDPAVMISGFASGFNLQSLAGFVVVQYIITNIISESFITNFYPNGGDEHSLLLWILILATWRGGLGWAMTYFFSFGAPRDSIAWNNAAGKVGVVSAVLSFIVIGMLVSVASEVARVAGHTGPEQAGFFIIFVLFIFFYFSLLGIRANI